MSGVRNLKAWAALLVVGLLGTLLVLALSACGGAGGQEQAKSRPLPLDPTGPAALSPGEYHSANFKPALSFEVGEGWENGEEQLSDTIDLGLQGCGPPGDLTCKLHLMNVKEVFKPGTSDVVDAPKDLLGWLQHHPYLKTSKPKSATVGGVKDEQFEVLVDHLPKDPNGFCGTDCVDIFNQSGGDRIGYFTEGRKRKVFVLEDVKGDTVVIWYAAPLDVFDEFAPVAQKVVDSVKWSGS
jgi:hypothetical protein